MPINIYLSFAGECREAVTFYAKVFRVTVPEMMRYGDRPSEGFTITAEQQDYVLHTSLTILGTEVMFSDTLPSPDFVKGTNFALTLITDDKDEITRIYTELGEGGEVDMPLEKTFFSEWFGMVTDRFGISWQLSHAAGA